MLIDPYFEEQLDFEFELYLDYWRKDIDIDYTVKLVKEITMRFDPGTEKIDDMLNLLKTI